MNFRTSNCRYTHVVGDVRLCVVIVHQVCIETDIEEFIDIKLDLNKITKANISLMITDEFMEAVEKKDKYYAKFVVDATGEIIT